MPGKHRHMNEMHEYILNELKKEIKLHGLKSGEIIIELDQINKDTNTSIFNLIDSFFFDNNIQTEHKDFTIKEIILNEAINSIVYGFSSKPNYTHIDRNLATPKKIK